MILEPSINSLRKLKIDKKEKKSSFFDFKLTWFSEPNREVEEDFDKEFGKCSEKVFEKVIKRNSAQDVLPKKKLFEITR